MGQAGTGSSGDRSRRRHTTVANGRVESALATGANLAGDHPDHPTQDSQWQVARRYLSQESLELVLVDEPTTQEVAQLTPA